LGRGSIKQIVQKCLRGISDSLFSSVCPRNLGKRPNLYREFTFETICFRRGLGLIEDRVSGLRFKLEVLFITTFSTSRQSVCMYVTSWVLRPGAVL
jgi:hypothetical protein